MGATNDHTELIATMSPLALTGNTMILMELIVYLFYFHHRKKVFPMMNIPIFPEELFLFVKISICSLQKK